MIFISKNDFLVNDISGFFSVNKKVCIPDVSIFLDSGAIIYATITDKEFKYHRYPDQEDDKEKFWYYMPFTNQISEGSVEGNILGFAYNILLEHLVNSYLEPPSVANYVKKMLVAKKSGIQKIN